LLQFNNLWEGIYDTIEPLDNRLDLLEFLNYAGQTDKKKKFEKMGVKDFSFFYTIDIKSRLKSLFLYFIRISA